MVTLPVTLTVTPPDLPLPLETATVLCHALESEVLQRAIALEAAQIPIRWQSLGQSLGSRTLAPDLQAFSCSAPLAPLDRPSYTWPKAPTVLALIPHWRCEAWLPRCLASLHQQTHPLTNIVVIDDASAQPPLEIVQRFENVTLLTALEQVGPYRLIQSVIDATDYHAYLFQDADDWSSGDRLATLLQTARTHGAALVGSQEIRVLEPQLQLQTVGYPLDVNLALAQGPGHPLLHPTSLVTRCLVQQLGGFATGLRFGGDTEFLLRAQWRARIVNSPRYCYFRRKRPDSLTTAVDTGLDSPARQALTQTLKARAIANHQAAQHHHPLDLCPLKTAPPISLRHIWGPTLRMR